MKEAKDQKPKNNKDLDFSLSKMKPGEYEVHVNIYHYCQVLI